MNFYLFKKKKILLIELTLILLLFNLILAFNNLQTKTTILGLRLNNRSLSYLDRTQIEQTIKDELLKNPNSLRFSYQDKLIEIKKEEIGTKIDPILLTNVLISKGRDASFFQNLFVQARTLLSLEEIKLTGDISQALLTIKIIDIQNQINQDAIPIMPDFLGDLSKTLKARDGVRVDTNKLTILIADNIFNPPLRPLTLPTIKTFTNHKEEELASVRKDFLAFTKQPIAIASAGEIFTLSIDDLKKLSTVIERPDPKNPEKLALTLRLDDHMLSKMLGEFAEKIEAKTHAEFDYHDSRVAIYSQFFSGKRYLAQIPTGSSLTMSVLGAQTEDKKVYLTFDDGPNSIYHPMILDILKSYNIKATFFLVGENSKRDQDIAKRTVSEGHKIGNHSLTHAFLPKLSTTSIQNELQATENILKPINQNRNIELFRPPYGGINLAVKQNAENLKLKLVLWDIDPRDWSEPETQELITRVVSNIHPGSDILLHSNHLATVRALPKIIEALKNQGYSFDTL